MSIPGIDASKAYMTRLETEVRDNLEEIEVHKATVNELRKANRRKRTLIQNVAKEHGIHTGE